MRLKIDQRLLILIIITEVSKYPGKFIRNSLINFIFKKVKRRDFTAGAHFISLLILIKLKH